MSQKFRIHSVKVDGWVMTDESTWTRSSREVMGWLCDGWRGLFNNFRQQRRWNGCKHPETDPLTKEQYRHSEPFRRALPTSLLQGVERQENREWFAGLKRIKTIHRGGPPKWKRRKEGPSFSVLGSGYTNVRQLSKRRAELTIGGRNPSGQYGPSRTLAWKVRIRFRISQEVSDYTSVMVNWSRGTLSFVNQPNSVERRGNGSVGIDLGVIHTVAISNGTFADIPRPTNEHNKRYKGLQRKLARQDRTNETRGGREAKFSSNRRWRTVMLIGAMDRKMANARRDWVEKVTTDLVRDNTFIAIEDLKPEQMSRKAQRRRIRKAGLNRGIRESCWGMFRARLEYKAWLAGTTVVAVNPAYTSQTCFNCGHIARENRESQAVFLCIECSYQANADTNAANNILKKGMQVHGAGQALGRGGSVSPEHGPVPAGTGPGSAREASTSRSIK